MDLLQRIGNCGVMPIVKLDNVKDAVPLANAILVGGIDVMAITPHTQWLDALKEITTNVPGICVGVANILNPQQGKSAVEAGARFLITLDFDHKLIAWCTEHNVPVIPNCITPAQVAEAVSLEISVVSHFPTEVYGGLDAIKSLSSLCENLKFLPLGQTSDNLTEYLTSSCVHAVGGNWIYNKKEAASGDFSAVVSRCKQARAVALGYEFTHLGINCSDGQAAQVVNQFFTESFGFRSFESPNAFYITDRLEVTKSLYPGQHGHIAIRTVNMERALADLAVKGTEVIMDTAGYMGGEMISVYLKDSIGGFAIHLLKR